MKLAGHLLQQLFPERCVHCGERLADRHLLCAACEATLRKAPDDPEIIRGGARAYALVYEGAAKSLFAAGKFSHRRRAQRLLADFAAESMQPLLQANALFIEMPSSRPFVHRLLKRVVPQGQLARGIFTMDRLGKLRANKLLKEADRFRRIAATLRLSGKPIPEAGLYVLCDDVLTTGATLGHAAWLLAQTGIAQKNISTWTLMFRERQHEGEG